MVKKLLIITCCLVLAGATWSQVNPSDSTPARASATAVSVTDSSALEDDLDIDALLNDLDLFLDSILAPRSYVLLNVSMTQGYFTFSKRNNVQIKEAKKAIWSPMLGYYDKSGFGISLASYVIYDSSKRYVYQGAFTPSYDYIKNRKLATGISFTRYFTRHRLPFYTSPLQNELNGYFLWRKSWIQPSVAASYGWGSRTDFQRVRVLYADAVKNALDRGTVPDIDTAYFIAQNRESIRDFSLTFSLRHDFYWLDIFSKKDHIRLSPMLAASAGTQTFGFNQSSPTFNTVRSVTYFNKRSISLQQKFQLLSSTLYLRGEYSYGKFFIQPQLIIDYYFPGEKSNLATFFSINAGFQL